MYAPRWYPTATLSPMLTSRACRPDGSGSRLSYSAPRVEERTEYLAGSNLCPACPASLSKNISSSKWKAFLDTSGTGSWAIVSKTIYPGARDYGSAVQYGDGKILIVGEDRRQQLAPK